MNQLSGRNLTWPTPGKLIAPLPNTSLTSATASRIQAYPIAFPTASNMDGPGLLASAKASRRPMMMQLVMMRPTKTDSFSEMSGLKALRTSSTMITSEAITTSCTMIRIRSGMMLRIKETMTFPPIITKRTAMLMMTACCTCTVMARAEQMPSTWTVMGLLSSSGSVRSLRFFLEKSDSFFGATAVAVSVLITSVLSERIGNTSGRCPWFCRPSHLPLWT